MFDVTKCAPEGAFMNLGKAFQNFSNGTAKYPKFKKKGRSSKKCSCCGQINAELTLTDRTYICTRCGMEKDRDLNAVENLNRAGLARIHACGHDGSVSGTHVTEATSMAEIGSEDVQ